MNSKSKQPAKVSINSKDYTDKNLSNQKRAREEDSEMHSKAKRRQPKTLYRPWCDNQATEVVIETANNKKDIPNEKHLPSAPLSLTPYQMAVHQQRNQTALALHQAYYQRQLIMSHLWAQQQRQQQHQQMLMYQQQMQQQLFVYSQQQGQNYKN